MHSSYKNNPVPLQIRIFWISQRRALQVVETSRHKWRCFGSCPWKNLFFTLPLYCIVWVFFVSSTSQLWWQHLLFFTRSTMQDENAWKWRTEARQELQKPPLGVFIEIKMFKCLKTTSQHTVHICLHGVFNIFLTFILCFCKALGVALWVNVAKQTNFTHLGWTLTLLNLHFRQLTS